MPISYSTLPRHPNQVELQWPSYSGTLAGIRNIPSVPANLPNNLPSMPPPPSTIAMHQFGGASRTRIYFREENEIDSETPLMIKRESVV